MSVGAMSAVGHSGEVIRPPVCKAIADFIGAGKKGKEVREQFRRAPFGWPQDAIDAALVIMTLAGNLRAVNNGQPVQATEMVQSQMGVLSFHVDIPPLTVVQRMELKALFQKLGIPTPDMLLRHLNSKKPLPEWITEVKTLYTTAMNEMYRANTRAREGSRSFTLYNAKRLEFTFHFISCIEALYKSHDPATRTESRDAAMESIYSALNSWSDVARDSSDRGGIALLNEYGYRPLVKAIKGGK